jgi:hypothetical protein
MRQALFDGGICGSVEALEEWQLAAMARESLPTIVVSPGIRQKMLIRTGTIIRMGDTIRMIRRAGGEYPTPTTAPEKSAEASGENIRSS